MTRAQTVRPAPIVETWQTITIQSITIALLLVITVYTIRVSIFYAAARPAWPEATHRVPVGVIVFAAGILLAAGEHTYRQITFPRPIYGLVGVVWMGLLAVAAFFVDRRQDRKENP